MLSAYLEVNFNLRDIYLVKKSKQIDGISKVQPLEILLSLEEINLFVTWSKFLSRVRIEETEIEFGKTL